MTDHDKTALAEITEPSVASSRITWGVDRMSSRKTRTIPACQLLAGELAGIPHKGRHSLVKWLVMDWASSVGLTVIRSQSDGETRTVKGDFQLVRMSRVVEKMEAA